MRCHESPCHEGRYSVPMPPPTGAAATKSLWSMWEPYLGVHRTEGAALALRFALLACFGQMRAASDKAATQAQREGPQHAPLAAGQARLCALDPAPSQHALGPSTQTAPLPPSRSDAMGLPAPSSLSACVRSTAISLDDSARPSAALAPGIMVRDMSGQVI